MCPAENYISQLPLQKEVAMKRKEKCGATENALLSVFTAFCLKGDLAARVTISGRQTQKKNQIEEIFNPLKTLNQHQ